MLTAFVDFVSRLAKQQDVLFVARGRFLNIGTQKIQVTESRYGVTVNSNNGLRTYPFVNAELVDDFKALVEIERISNLIVGP